MIQRWEFIKRKQENTLSTKKANKKKKKKKENTLSTKKANKTVRERLTYLDLELLNHVKAMIYM